MTFNQYANLALKTIYRKKSETHKEIIARIALGVGGEAGEVCEKTKKYLRGDKNFSETRELIAMEIGDVLWYLAILCSAKYGFNLNLGCIAEENLQKLQDRKKRKKLKGSGDNR